MAEKDLKHDENEATQGTKEAPVEPAQESSEPVKPIQESSAREGEQSKRRGGGIVWLALLLALAAAVLSGYLFWRAYQARQAPAAPAAAEAVKSAQAAESRVAELSTRMDKLQTKLNRTTQETANALQLAKGGSGVPKAVTRQLKNLQAEQTALLTSVKSVQQFQAGIEAQIQQFAKSLEQVTAGDSLRRVQLAEATMLIRAGYQAVNLHDNARMAAKYLSLADAQLASVDMAGLAGVRRALNAELQALKAVPAVDVVGASAKLHALIQAVPDWSVKHALGKKAFKSEAKPKGEEDKGWWNATQSFLGRYFTVRRTTQTGTKLLSPETLHLVREQLQLKLEEARLALLQQSPQLYQAALQQSEAWIKQYFDTSDLSVQAALNTIQALQAADIAPKLPDTGAALRALDDVRQELG